MSNTHATRIASHRSDVQYCGVHTRVRADPNVIHKSIASLVLVHIRMSALVSCRTAQRAFNMCVHILSTLLEQYSTRSRLETRRDETRRDAFAELFALRLRLISTRCDLLI